MIFSLLNSDRCTSGTSLKILITELQNELLADVMHFVC